MASYLIDTNVVSETSKPRSDSAVLSWVELHKHDLYLSVLTLGELRRGVVSAVRRQRPAADRLTAWINEIDQKFEDRRLDVGLEVVRAWAELPTTRTLPVIDSLLAATAKVHGLVIATRNLRDIADLGVPVVNPWDPSTW